MPFSFMAKGCCLSIAQHGRRLRIKRKKEVMKVVLPMHESQLPIPRESHSGNGLGLPRPGASAETDSEKTLKRRRLGRGILHIVVRSVLGKVANTAKQSDVHSLWGKGVQTLPSREPCEIIRCRSLCMRSMIYLSCPFFSFFRSLPWFPPPPPGMPCA